MDSASDVLIRQADPSDLDGIADAHRDSIQSIGPSFYSADDVAHWQEGIASALYLNAMATGEVFFIATTIVNSAPIVLGFASDYAIDRTTYGTSVYVRGMASGRGIGTALLRAAEAHAAANGCERIEIAASLAGVEFYRANGYLEIGRGETRLTSGHQIECVFMRKNMV